MQNFNSTSAKVKIESDPLIVWIEKDVLYEFDLNNNSVNDLRVKYEGINNTKARVFIQEIILPSEENYEKPSIEKDVAYENKELTKSARENYLYLLVAFVIFILTGIKLLLTKKSKNKRN